MGHSFNTRSRITNRFQILISLRVTYERATSSHLFKPSEFRCLSRPVPCVSPAKQCDERENRRRVATSMRETISRVT